MGPVLMALSEAWLLGKAKTRPGRRLEQGWVRPSGVLSLHLQLVAGDNITSTHPQPSTITGNAPAEPLRARGRSKRNQAPLDGAVPQRP